jgi:hypothetical protein
VLLPAFGSTKGRRRRRSNGFELITLCWLIYLESLVDKYLFTELFNRHIFKNSSWQIFLEVNKG